jgi:hypothetical protein
MDFTELKELLKGIPAFAILSNDELERFGNHFELVYHTLGQTVVGDEADSFYVVYSGRARVIGNSATARKLPLAHLPEVNHSASRVF